MASSREPKLLDIIAVTRAPEGEKGVEVGDVGTVVELLSPNAVEVEFLDRSGQTRALATLRVGDVLVLNVERTQVA